MLSISNILGIALLDTARTLLTFLPNVILAVIIFVLGWAAGVIVGRAVTHVINVIKLDGALNKAGLSALSDKIGVKISVAGFVGGVIKWAMIVAFALTAADILGLSQITQLLHDILLYIPNVIVAAIVLIVATLLGDFVSRLVSHSAQGVGVKGEFAASVSKWAIIIVGGVFPALTQLHIAQGLVEVLFTGVVFALSLALGLAFGLGGRDAAAKAIERMK